MHHSAVPSFPDVHLLSSALLITLQKKVFTTFNWLRIEPNKCSCDLFARCLKDRRWIKPWLYDTQMPLDRTWEKSVFCVDPLSILPFFIDFFWPDFCSLQPGHPPRLILPSPSSSEKTFLMPPITSPYLAPLTHLLSTCSYPNKNVFHWDLRPP